MAMLYKYLGQLECYINISAQFYSLCNNLAEHFVLRIDGDSLFIGKIIYGLKIVSKTYVEGF